MPTVEPWQLVVEKTPSYFYDEDVPERIRLLNSGMKLILTVRDPVERIASKLGMIYRRGTTNATVEEILTGENVS